MHMRRRRVIQGIAGVLTGTVAGCTTGGQVFETYNYEKDAPVTGPVARPWRTMGYDAQRSGFTPYGWLPERSTVDLFVPTGRPLDMQPAFIDGTAYFGDSQVEPEVSGADSMTGLRAADDRGEGWFFPIPGSVGSPTVVSNAIFVTVNGVTRAFDRRDGTECWSYTNGTSRSTASPTVMDEFVYVSGDRVYALAQVTGEVQWATNRLASDILGTAATKSGVFATTGDNGRGTVSRIDPATGREEWTSTTDSEILGPPVLGDLVSVVEATGRIRAFDPGDGSEVWSQRLGNRSAAMPAFARETVYAAATDPGMVKAFEAGSGTVRWEVTDPVGSNVLRPTIGGDTVYVPTRIGEAGRIIEISAKGGDVRRSHELPQPPATPLVVGFGVGLIGTGEVASNSGLQLLTYPEPEETRIT